MTQQSSSYSHLSSPTTVSTPTVGTAARQFTEPLRELIALVLLAGNGVFLALGFSGLFFVLDRWASDFALRCGAVFGTFVGPYSLGLPIGAMLLATHVFPMVPRSRAILIAVLSELGVSALFGAVTFLGAFANDLSSARATIEGLLWRGVWLAFLMFACIVVVRLWMGLYPPAKPGAVTYPSYRQPTYGSPYPGQPMYPQPTYTPGTAQPNYGAATETATDPETGWPIVPPPPVPTPLIMSNSEPTTRIPVDTLELGGDATQKIPIPVQEAPAPVDAAPPPVPVEAAPAPVPVEATPAPVRENEPADRVEPATDPIDR